MRERPPRVALPQGGATACTEASLDQLKGAEALAALEKDGHLFASPAWTARIMRRDIRTIYAAIKNGEIPSIKIGQRYSVSVSWLRRRVDGLPEPESSAAGGVPQIKTKTRGRR